VEAERYIRTQFKMERIVYCQDDIYFNDLNSVKAENATKAGNGKELFVVSIANQEPSFVQEMVSHTKAYFNVSLQATIQHFFCTWNAITYTSRPDLSAVNMSLSCNTTTMQGIVARGCILSRHTHSFSTD